MNKEQGTRRQKYSRLSLKQSMQLVPTEVFIPWKLAATPRPPSATLQANLQSLEAFDLKTSEAAKVLLMDMVFADVVPSHPKLRIWKEVTLVTDTLTGLADYVIAPKRAYLETPLLCVSEAKRDNFERGAAQCIAEMVACRWNNKEQGHETDIFGIVSNGQDWQFYALKTNNMVYETPVYPMTNLPELLGALDFICAECAKNAP
jgi:hypothetical protein